MDKCRYCHKPLPASTKPGPKRQWCDNNDSCRKKFDRHGPMPEAKHGPGAAYPIYLSEKLRENYCDKHDFMFIEMWLEAGAWASFDKGCPDCKRYRECERQAQIEADSMREEIGRRADAELQSRVERISAETEKELERRLPALRALIAGELIAAEESIPIDDYRDLLKDGIRSQIIADRTAELFTANAESEALVCR